MKMKTIFSKKVLLALAVAAGSFTLQSCLDDDDDDNYSLLIPNALVTVKPAADNSSFYMQLDDITRLNPVNL